MSATVTPKRITKDDLPARRTGGPSISPRQRFVNKTLADNVDDLVNLQGTDDVLAFTFTKDDDESFTDTSPTAHTAKDACRRCFKKGLEEVDLGFTPKVQYNFDGHLEQLPKGEVLFNGFTAFVYWEPEEEE